MSCGDKPVVAQGRSFDVCIDIKTGKIHNVGHRNACTHTHLHNDSHLRCVLSFHKPSCLACDCRRIARSLGFIRMEPSALALPCLWQQLNKGMVDITSLSNQQRICWTLWNGGYVRGTWKIRAYTCCISHVRQ